MAPEDCPFCQRIRSGEFLASSELAVVLADGFPLNLGHALVVPRRHLAGSFDLSPDEQVALWKLVSETQRALHRDHAPDGSNLGVNVGVAAGQTVAHVHVHLIPRYDGDVEDPRGGVRAVVPARARYWERKP